MPSKDLRGVLEPGTVFDAVRDDNTVAIVRVTDTVRDTDTVCDERPVAIVGVTVTEGDGVTVVEGSPVATVGVTDTEDEGQGEDVWVD